MDQAPGLAVIRAGQLDAAARAAYAAAFSARCDTTGGLGTMDAALAGAALFEVVVMGAVVARYAIKEFQRPHGVEAYVMAAAGGLPGVDLIRTLEPTIALHCQAADRMKFATRRRGLVKKMVRQGWVIDSYVLGKKIK